METTRITIYEIAEMAGVSIGTVSRVINGRDRVAPETRQRVLAIAEKHHFRPNAAARGLATSRTQTILFLVSDVGNLYFSEMAKKLGLRAGNHGYRIVLGDSDETIAKEGEYLRALADGHVDGAIIAPLTTPANVPLYRALIERGFPLVLLDTALEGIELPSVAVDNVLGARMAVDYLAAKGHTRIAFVSGNIEFQTNRLRFQGYREALESRDLATHPDYMVLNQDFLVQERFCGVERLLALPTPPTAIFATSDLTALACVVKIRALGRRVPEDIAVVGFDDIVISGLMEVPLTTVRQPKDEIAQRAIEALLSQLERSGGAAGKLGNIRIPPTIIERVSA